MRIVMVGRPSSRPAAEDDMSYQQDYDPTGLIIRVNARLLGALIFVSATTIGQSGKSTTDGSSTAAKSASQILEENRRSIAIIVAAGNTSLNLGTGFFVRSSGLLLTNLHVVEGMSLVGVKGPDDNEVVWAKKV